MKTTAAFRALTANRKAAAVAAANAAGSFAVCKVLKSGALGKPTADHAGQSVFPIEQARAFRQRLQELNPGKSWDIVVA